ncbi:PREDICTED: fibrillin-2-like [Nicrophorus vespilloides]|uniref:Fibrillin-2-like n=1 Tax=Nicrophorus vespilloides TaxID=110193 RepID=A0ABM1MM69_NICVS|nr:PREDICTED: fibrillin-2-like [Nicrophorus vespilloides]
MMPIARKGLMSWAVRWFVASALIVISSAEPPAAPRDDQLQPVTPGGPNVCRSKSRTYCCPGWARHHSLGLCVIPVCTRPCSPGRCYQPNLCMCEDGRRATSCLAKYGSEGGNCRAVCMNGGTCKDGKCECNAGYTGEFCTEPICTRSCENGGRCVGPNRCACIYGFTGNHCEIDFRTGPCYTGYRGNLCLNQLEGVVCTKTLCCATVGKAWGHPCQHCPSRLDCNTGFLKKQKTGECIDINECDTIPHLCRGGKCVNTIGSFECECPVGQSRNVETNQCDDRDECLEEGICEDGRCVNTVGGYYCLCNPGFIQSQDRTYCIDGRQGYCYTMRENNQCHYHLPHKLSKKDCCCGVNMGKGWGDNCDRCPEHGEGEHRSLCFGGMHTMPKDYHSSGNKSSLDIGLLTVNECVLRPGICGKGECIDTREGYQCNCYPGFYMAESGKCEDIDECRSGKCQNGVCTNTPGSFNCLCPSGFDISPDGSLCTDHDECSEIGMCTNGICINMDGSFKCQCKSGYKLSPSGHACIDIDECYENPRICLNGRCENTPGSYNCVCLTGFVVSSDRTFCSDLDECANTGMCIHGRCVNMEGSFKCVCDSGYKLGPDGHHCMDIDECIQDPCKHGTCYNSPGSFRCECHSGFSLGADGRSCLDTRRDLCYQQYKDGVCLNPSSIAVTKSSCCCCTVVTGQPMGWGTSCQACPTFGTSEFDSLCPHGPGQTFDGNDINECAQNPNICLNGACENMIGTYRCICNPGYKVDDGGKFCTDINECEEEELVCSGGQCRNTPGSFQCICPTGTQLNPNSFTCDDIDECRELGPEACFNGECVNTAGSYKCECDPGSILDNTGRICIDNRKGSCWTRMNHGKCENNLPLLSRRQECCCSVGLAWGSPCERCNRNECECPRGYAKVDGKACSDINECELNPDICRGGGTCINTEGSFTCTCPSGLTLDNTRTQCLDIRQEKCYTRYKHGKCTHFVDGIFNKNLCCCSSIGRAWGEKCELCPRLGTPAFTELCPRGSGFLERKDINECTEFPGICQNGRCKNTIGGYSCRCNKGYDFDENRIKCIDIDECSITTNNVCGNGVCKNTPGDFVCECNEGFRTMAPMQICMDINECEEIIGLCRGGRCINTEGSYKCECPPGHELSSDKQYCKDIDECSRTSGICSNGVCENMMGTYQCVCDEGYEQNGQKTHCEDFDECEDEPCDDICTNTLGSYSCSCGNGYALQLDGKSCKDIDECKENTRICSGGKCVNTEGGYICHCTDGLIPGVGGTSCLDIDECKQNPNICGNGDCVNTLGSFQCRCEDGYSVKPDAGASCSDDDECYLGSYNCHVNADCINNPGSYQCRCQDGFTGNGVSCRDINECLTNNGGCDQNAQCVNSDGSFKCICDAGFKGDGYSCIDIDECSNNPSLCENGQCLNTPGAFRCECEMGFMHPNEKNDQACIDINECKMFNNLCVFGKCENTFGMFRCECNDGYKLDGSGGNCTDIDECESPQSCLYGKCTNTDGSFDCQCPANYDLVDEGNACIDKRVSRCYLNADHNRHCSNPTADYISKPTCCCSVGKAWGPNCELCPSENSKEYQELCPGGMGYTPNIITVVLEDINECEEHNNICKNGHCTNTFGSFMCSCNEGFRLDETGAVCDDINECEEHPDICSIGKCVNELGKYYCQCPEGYMSLPGKKQCVDMRKDFCYMNYERWTCSLPMSQNQTKKICCCSMGEGWGSPCEPCPIPGTNEFNGLCGKSVPGQIINPMTNRSEEIDECEMIPTLCKNGDCMNTPGSFECNCNRGYTYDINSHYCIDENECLRVPNPCEGNAQCINLPGSFECKCPEGYKHGTSFMDCVDVNECSDRHRICANGECKNLQGSFQCICNPGFILTTARDNCIDIDECARHPNICNDGTCVNTIGSYKCHCNPGFKLSPNNDCVDEDECHMKPYLCRNGRCRNNIGSFVCDCAHGYTLSVDGTHCRDIDECHESAGTCPPPGKCQNIMGSHICNCPDGYEISSVTNRCEDIDECNNPGICDNGICVNTEGGAYCTCPDGFILNSHQMKCIDVRKEQCYDHFFSRFCSEPRGMSMTERECCCSRGAAWGRSCEECPSEGSPEYLRLCPEGPGRMDTGSDINECELMPNVCEGGDCINTDGSFRCDCPSGYVLDNTGKKCIDDNECIIGQNICGNGTCSNVVGGFECSCNDGFAPGPLQVCEDVNECHEIGNQCAFRCHNVPGSFRCICPYGYALAPDGRHCQDVDECNTPANNCKFQCKNLIGSFMCICPEGYTQVGMTDNCVDVNECSMNPSLCSNGNCINTQGSYRCDCIDGFESSQDQKSCVDRRQGFCFRQLIHGRCTTHNREMRRVTKADCCCSMGEAWGSNCEICPSKYSPQYQELCLESGFTVDGQDVDECATIPDLCRNGKCINTLGSYRCICDKGFKPDGLGLQCYDVNECELNPAPCQYNCQNTEGSYTCSCPPGFLLNPDGSSCRDQDECASGQHLCQHNCINTQGSYTCSCHSGYTQDGDDCIDINECLQEGVCPRPGKCVNILGSFKCICPRGFKLDSTGTYCVDADECLDDTKCSEGCQNLIGGFKCGCPEGYYLHHYYNHCVDKNECNNSPCGATGTCFNTPGSYRCGCPDGFQFDSKLNNCIQMSSSCMGAPCAFGCTALGPQSFSCGCPQGYQRIGQGHCLATITPYGQDIGNVPTYPIGDPVADDKLISTEGCFSCKINGRHRRESRRNRQVANSTLFDLAPRSLRTMRRSVRRNKRHGHGQEIDITINLSQTKHRMRIVKVQPAVTREMDYKIVEGTDTKKFELLKKNGVWGLHFRRRLKHPGKFDIVIHGRPADLQAKRHFENDLYEKPLTLRVRLNVVE